MEEYIRRLHRGTAQRTRVRRTPSGGRPSKETDARNTNHSGDERIGVSQIISGQRMEIPWPARLNDLGLRTTIRSRADEGVE